MLRQLVFVLFVVSLVLSGINCGTAKEPTPTSGEIFTLPYSVTLEHRGSPDIEIDETYQVTCQNLQIVKLFSGAERWVGRVEIKRILPPDSVRITLCVEFDKDEGELLEESWASPPPMAKGKLIRMQTEVSSGKTFKIVYPLEATYAVFWVETLK